MENSTIQMDLNVTSNISDILSSTIASFGMDEELFQLQEKVSNVMFYVRFIIVAMRLVGNILIMIVMSRKNDGNSSSTFFVVLAASDLVVTIFGPLETIVDYFYPIATSPRMLTFVIITLYTTEYMASWMIVLLTAERVISVAAPYRIKDICFNKLKIASIIATSLFMLTYTVIAYNVLQEASIHQSGALYFKQNYPGISGVVMWADACLKFFIPVSLLITGSIFIIYKIAVSGMRSGNNSSRRLNYITLVFLASVLMFIVTMVPYYIITFMIYSLRYEVDEYLYFVGYPIAVVLTQANSALNFYVYFLAGSQFRKDVRNLFISCKTRLTSKRVVNNIT